MILFKAEHRLQLLTGSIYMTTSTPFFKIDVTVFQIINYLLCFWLWLLPALCCSLWLFVIWFFLTISSSWCLLSILSLFSTLTLGCGLDDCDCFIVIRNCLDLINYKNDANVFGCKFPHAAILTNIPDYTSPFLQFQRRLRHIHSVLSIRVRKTKRRSKKTRGSDWSLSWLYKC